MKGFSAKFKEFWGGLAKGTKTLLVSAIVLVLLAAIGFAIYLNVKNSGYTVLFEGMDSTETTEVYNELKGKSVDVRIDSDGNLLVPTEQWDTLVYELASLGYPQSTPSYGVFFDNISMTMTDFEKHETLRFELQDRLQTTLKRIKGIKGAIVTITYPKDSNYVWQETEDKATASVTLTLENSNSFTSENVAAVKNLVAYSAQQMSPEDVKVIDANTGRELSGGEGSDPDYEINSRQYYEKVIREQLEDGVVRLLSPMYGKGNVVAVANITVNYDKVTEETNQYLTDEDGDGVRKYAKIIMEKYRGDEASGGIVGEEDNTDIPSYLNNDGTVDVNNPDYLEEEMEWAIGNVLTQTEKAQGVLTDSSISVVIRSENVVTDNEKQNIIGLIKNASGIGDIENISVMSWQGDGNSGTINNTTNERQLSFKDYLWIIIAIVAVILLLVIAIIIFTNRRAKRKIAKAKAANMEKIAILENKIEESERRTLIEKATENNREQKETANEVRKFAKQNPDLTASIIRTMIKGDDNK